MKYLTLLLFLTSTTLLSQDTLDYEYKIKQKHISNCEYSVVIDNPINPDIVTIINGVDTIRLIVFVDTNSINNDINYGFVRLNVVGYDKIKSIDVLPYSLIIVYKHKETILTMLDPKIKLYDSLSLKRKKFDWEYWKENYKGDRCYLIK